MTLPTRAAERTDVPAILDLLRQFGRYWEHPEWVSADVAALEAALFDAPCAGHGIVACDGSAVVGCALWFLGHNFWTARPVLILEDLFIDPAARRLGAGRALMRAVAVEAVRRDCVWMDWSVLDADTRAENFYASLGAVPWREATTWRLDADGLARLARG